MRLSPLTRHKCWGLSHEPRCERVLAWLLDIEKADTSGIEPRQRYLAMNEPRSARPPAIDTLFCLALFASVVLSRAFTSGHVCYVVGPLHRVAIANGSYVMQPPGYWLFNRMAAFFPDPAHGTLIFNWLVSAAGAVVCYLTAQRLLQPDRAQLVAILDSVVSLRGSPAM